MGTGTKEGKDVLGVSVVEDGPRTDYKYFSLTPGTFYFRYSSSYALEIDPEWRHRGVRFEVRLTTDTDRAETVRRCVAPTAVGLPIEG